MRGRRGLVAPRLHGPPRRRRRNAYLACPGRRTMQRVGGWFVASAAASAEFGSGESLSRVSQEPFHCGEIGECHRFVIFEKTETLMRIIRRWRRVERGAQRRFGLGQAPLIEPQRADYAQRRAAFARLSMRLSVAKEGLGDFVAAAISPATSRVPQSTNIASKRAREEAPESPMPLRRRRWSRGVRSPCQASKRAHSWLATPPATGVCQTLLRRPHSRPTPRAASAPRRPRAAAPPSLRRALPVRHLDRLAEMRNRFLNAERLSAASPALPHHSMAGSVSPASVKWWASTSGCCSQHRRSAREGRRRRGREARAGGSSTACRRPHPVQAHA